MGTTTIKKHFTRLALEKRIMFDAAALDTAFEALPSSGGVNTEATEASPTDINNVVAALTDLSQEDAQRSVYFIDDSLPDQSVLTAAIPADATIITLATNQDGLVQIADSLQGLTNIEAIHIIAHATDGSLQLGNSIIDAASVTDLYAEQLASINQSLTEGADILFYGCDFASTESGIETLQALATSLGADLAASDDITGISGDWDLEQQTGIIEAATFAAENWNHNLLILPVAVDDIAIVEEDSTNILDVTANDINPLEPDPITITSAVAGQGTVEINPDNTLTYTPNANFFGADVITYTISDPDGAALVPGIVAVTVNPVDDLPSLVLPVSIPLFLEDTALVFADVLGTQISLGDLDGGVAVVSLSVPIGDLSLAQTAGLTLSQGDGVNDNEITMEGDIADLNAALNGLIYTPDADYNGPVTITIGITDTLLSLPITATLPLSISAVADIVDDNVSTIIDTPVAFNVMDNDTFENATAIVTSYTTPLHGTITVDAQGQALYTPDSGYTGTDSFTYTVSSNGTTETATVTLTSSLPNTPPTIDVPGTQNSDEDTNLVFSTATSNAITIGDGEASSLTVTLQSTQGVMTLGQTTGISFTTGDGDSDSDIVMSGSITDINAALDGLTYTPTADYYGAATVTVQASDGEASQTSSINVLMVGDIDGVTDDITTDVQTPISFFPLANDTYENTPSLTSVSAGSHGTAVIGVGNSITYTPDAGYRGDDSFTYTVESGGTTEVITVDVTVGINNAPSSTDLVALSLVDNQLVSLSTSLSFSDTDLFDVLTYSATGLPSGLSIDPTTGIILGTVDAHASVLTPDGRYDVVVTATDIAGLSADANLQIQVINPDPIVSAGVATGLEDSDLNLDVLLNASDPDGDALSVDAASALNGTVSINPDGSLTYVPNADFFGIDTLTYTVVDEDGGSATGTITVTVENVLDLPTISIPTLDLFTEDTPLIFADLLGQQISVGDIDGELLDIRLSVPVGTLTLNETAGVSLSEGDGIDDSIVRLSGNVADINVALNNLVYTPGADYNGPVQITVELGQLGQLLLVNAQVPLGIEAVADIVDDTISATEDIPVNFNVLDNDSFENAGRIVDSYTTPSFGTVIIDAQGNATYTPGTSFTGTDSFTYTVLSNGTYETATVTINVNPPVNADPTSSAVGNQTANDGELFSLDISGNFADADGDTLTYSASGLPTGLTLDTATGIISGTLGSSASTQIANGEYGITITANDGNGGLVSESFSLTISNPAPTAVADSFSGDEDDNITGNVLLNDSDSDGDSLSVNTSPIVPPLHGSLTLNGDGSFVYIPDPNYNGNDTFTYQVIDADGGTANAVVSLTVNAVNDTPIVTGESATTDEDTPVTVDVLANDTDADGDSLSVDSATATNGTVAINPDGTITYTPNANFTGSDTITYTVSDGNGGTSTATVAVTINAVNDNPTTAGESATTDEDTPVTVDVLANDSDAEGDTLTVDSATAGNGTVAINPDGTITYTPNADFNGSDTITYTVSDGNGGSSTATVAVTVNPINDNPNAVNDSASTNENTPAIITVLDNDTDSDGDSLSVSSASAANGTVSINPDGTLTYIPNLGFNGTDTISYSINDGNGGVANATVSVNVNAAGNNSPSANNDSASLNEDTSANIDVLANDTDTDGDTLTVDSATAGNGIVAINPDGTITYTPDANFTGSDTITYTVSDGNGGTSSAIVNVTVDPINDAPTTAGESATTDEDTPVTVDVLANDSDVEGDTLTVDSATAANGTVAINPDGTITYTPNANFTGSDTITYTVTDGNGGTATATVAVTINAVNDNPTTAGESATTDEDTPVTVDVLANDSDVDGDTLSVDSATAPNGTVAINPDGTITYTPDANFTGSDTITYTVTDGNGGTATATVAVTINAVNDNPTTTGESATTDEDTPVTVDVLANDSDVDGDTLSVDSATTPNGTVAINPDGTITYTPNANFTGSDTITYTVSDGNGGTATATVAVTINAVNDNPTTTGESATTDEDTPVTVDILANDSDAEGDTLTVDSATAGNGTVVINPDGTITYTPDANFTGSDTITYTVSDGNGGTSTATVAVTINAVNDNPTTAGESATTDEDTPVTIDVLANDSDVEGDTLTVDSATAANGTVAINPDGTITYTPNANFTGSDTITYTVSDGNGGTATATVAVTINAVNDNPTTTGESATTDEDTPVTVDVLANDSDVDGDTLSVDSATAPNGTVAINPDGTITYTPDANFTGSDTITYTVTDGNGGTATATVAVTINAVNDNPTTTGESATTDEDTPVTVDILANDSDAEGDTLTVDSATAGNGTVAINPDGTITYTPNANFTGSDTITYTVSDGNGGTATATVAVTINAVNDNPTTAGESATTDEDTPVTVDVLANDSDVDGDTLTVDSATAGNGTVAINPDGTITYTPNADFNGSDTITYTVSDGNGGTSTATVAVTVNPINDNPNAVNDSASTNENTPAIITVLDNDTDPDGDSLSVSSASAANGTVSINPDGTLTYIPNLGFNGTDTISYSINDGNGGVANATVSVNVNAAGNNSPSANNDSASLNEDTSANIDVLANDTDTDGDTLTVDSATAGNGTVAINPDGTITYTPNANFTGSDTITYTVSDGNGGTSSAIVNVTVDPINDAPTTAGESATTDEDTPVTVDVLANDSDVEGDTLTVDSATAANGTVAINPDGTITYTPNANFTGSDTITYTVTDGNGGTSTATVAVTINAVNDNPTTVGESATTDEDTPVTIDVLANDSDVEGDTLTVDSASAANGTVAINPDGTITYTPDANFTGSDTITYTVSDGNGGTSTVTMEVTINAVNDAPTIAESTAITDEDTPVTLDVLANASDADGDTLSIDSATTTNGSVTINGDGTLSFVPQDNFNGTSTITYTVTDGNGGTSTSTITVDVAPVNDAPSTADEIANTDEDTTVTIDVLANDTDIEGGALSVETANANNGTVVINGDGTLNYTPDTNFNGQDTITYTVADEAGSTSTATTTVVIAPINDAPNIAPQNATATEDTPITIDVLVNANDVDGDTLSINSATSENGTVSIGNDGSITYTPNPNFAGNDTITYVITDSQGGAQTAVVSISVTPVNDAPDVTNNLATTPGNTALTLNVLDQITDVDSDSLVISTATADNGTVIINNDQSITYQPNTNFSGTDTISVSVSDGNDTSISTITVQVDETVVQVEQQESPRSDAATPTSQNTNTPLDIELVEYDPVLLDALNGVQQLEGLANLTTNSPIVESVSFMQQLGGLTELTIDSSIINQTVNYLSEQATTSPQAEALTDSFLESNPENILDIVDENNINEDELINLENEQANNAQVSESLAANPYNNLVLQPLTFSEQVNETTNQPSEEFKSIIKALT